MAKSGLMGGQGIGEFFSRGPGGILPERGSQAQYDLVSGLLQSGMGAAQQSGSPLLALLAPMLGGAIGNRTQSLYDQAQQERSSASTDQLLSLMGGGNAQASALMGILGDQDAPDHVQSIARSMLGKSFKTSGGGGTKRRRSGGGRSSRPASLSQINVATDMVAGAIKDLVKSGMSSEEARSAVRNDPMYARQWAAIDGGSNQVAAASPRVETPVVPQSNLAQPGLDQIAPPPPPEGTVEF